MGVLATNILEGEGHFYLDRVPNELARIVVDTTEKVSSKYIHDKRYTSSFLKSRTLKHKSILHISVTGYHCKQNH